MKAIRLFTFKINCEKVTLIEETWRGTQGDLLSGWGGRRAQWVGRETYSVGGEGDLLSEWGECIRHLLNSIKHAFSGTYSVI